MLIMARLTRRLTLLLMLACLLAACGSNKNKELQPVDLERIDTEVDVDRLWSAKISGDLGKYYHEFLPAIDHDDLYAASAAGKVCRIGKDDGKKHWCIKMEKPLTTAVAVDDRHAYVADISGALIALDKLGGDEVWRYQLDSELVTPPSVYNGHLLLQTGAGVIYDLDPASGEVRWQHVTTMPTLSLRGNSQAAFFGDFAVFGLASGKLAVLDLATGELRWDPRIAVPKGDTEIERMVDVDATPLVEQDKLYAVSYQGQLAAWHLANGRPLWSVDASSYQDLSHALGRVFITGSDSIIKAYNADSGELEWQQDAMLRRKLTAPVVVGSYLVVADYKGYVHFLSQLDGRIVARKRVSFSSVKSRVLADGSNIYVMADNGRIKAYRINGEKP